MSDWAGFPDTEAIAIKALRDAGVCGGRVYSSVPNTPTWPILVVQRLGGLPAVERRLDRARVQVDAWGTNKAEARDAAEAARLALHRAEGDAFPSLAGYVTGVEDELGLMFLPDQETKRDRYIFAVAVYAHSYVT